MKKTILIPMFLLFLGCKETAVKKEIPVSEQESTYKKPVDQSFIFQGRIENSDEGHVALISPGASVKFKAEADSVIVYLKAEGPNHNYAVVEINGDYINRYQISKDSVTPVYLKLRENQVNEVGIFKATEAGIGDLLFQGVETTDLQPFSNESNYTIEFIGNSITCGMGADTTDIPCAEGEWYDQHNAYLAYGPRVARQLNAQFIVSSVSGMGMYRNWNDEDKPVMPDVYKTLRLDGSMGEDWDAKHQPDLVSICLGTNDLSDGDGIKERKAFDKEKFTQNYIGFVSQIFEDHPKTKVALLTSPMIPAEAEKGKILLECLKKVEAYFEENHVIDIFQFEAINPHGCGSHPDIEDHKKMADMLLPFYKDLLTSNN